MIDAAIAALNYDKRKIGLSIKLLDELQTTYPVSKFSLPLARKSAA